MNKVIHFDQNTTQLREVTAPKYASLFSKVLLKFPEVISTSLPPERELYFPNQTTLRDNCRPVRYIGEDIVPPVLSMTALGGSGRSAFESIIRDSSPTTNGRHNRSFTILSMPGHDGTWTGLTRVTANNTINSLLSERNILVQQTGMAPVGLFASFAASFALIADQLWQRQTGAEPLFSKLIIISPPFHLKSPLHRFMTGIVLKDYLRSPDDPAWNKYAIKLNDSGSSEPGNVHYTYVPLKAYLECASVYRSAREYFEQTKLNITMVFGDNDCWLSHRRFEMVVKAESNTKDSKHPNPNLELIYLEGGTHNLMFNQMPGGERRNAGILTKLL